jgi:DNA-binding response OmpR family regulator
VAAEETTAVLISDDLDGVAMLTDHVHLIRWPAEEPRRLHLQEAGQPRILLLAAHAAPPESWDELEDWIRLPLDPGEIRTRARTLRRRARRVARPVLEPGGILRAGDRWIDLAVGPYAVVEVLVECFGELVHAEEIEAVYLGHGGSSRSSARKAMIVRLRRRVAELGLELHNVRDRGYLLDWEEDDGATRPSDGRFAS